MVDGLGPAISPGRALSDVGEHYLVREHEDVHRRVQLLLATIAIALAVAILPTAAVSAQDDGSSDTSVTTSELPESQGIVPEPNSGVAPTEAGDRGGALQTALFVLVIVGVGGIAYLVVRESRKAKAARGF